MRAYTLTFDEAQYDEGPFAKEMAQLAGADFNPVPITQSDLAANFRDSVVQAELPCLNAHSTAKYMLSRAVRQSGYKVVLTGEGSDEILAGYPHFRRDMILYHTAGQDPAEVAKLMQQLEEANQVSRGLLMPVRRNRLREHLSGAARLRPILARCADRADPALPPAHAR